MLKKKSDNPRQCNKTQTHGQPHTHFEVQASSWIFRYTDSLCVIKGSSPLVDNEELGIKNKQKILVIKRINEALIKNHQYLVLSHIPVLASN